MEGRGFGFSALKPAAGASSPKPTIPVAAKAQQSAAPASPRGRVLERQRVRAMPPDASLRSQMPALLVIILFFLIGVALEARARRIIFLRKSAHASA